MSDCAMRRAVTPRTPPRGGGHPGGRHSATAAAVRTAAMTISTCWPSRSRFAGFWPSGILSGWPIPTRPRPKPRHPQAASAGGGWCSTGCGLCLRMIFVISADGLVVVHGSAAARRGGVLKDAGAFIYYDFQYDDSQKHQLTKPPHWPAWLVDLLGVDYFANVVFVRLDHETTDSDIACMESFTALKFLWFYGTKVSNAEIVRLQKSLPNCKILRFTECRQPGL